jgi:hypothetical protein
MEFLRKRQSFSLGLHFQGKGPMLANMFPALVVGRGADIEYMKI